MFLEHDGASFEEDVGFHLVAFVEEADGVFELEVVVSLCGLRSEADFFHFDFHLLCLHLLLPLFLLVEEFGVVDEAADRWGGVGRNLYEIYFLILCKLESLAYRHDG